MQMEVQRRYSMKSAVAVNCSQVKPITRGPAQQGQGLGQVSRKGLCKSLLFSMSVPVDIWMFLSLFSVSISTGNIV